MTQTYTLDSEHVTQELSIAHPVSIEDQCAALSDVTEHAVTVELDPDVMLVTAGEQGPPGTPGPSAFDDWLARNPGGTFEQFLAAIGSGASDTVQRVAGETISALRAVYELNGLVYLADAADAVTVYLALGVALTAATTGGALTVQRTDEINDAGWSWTPGVVWLGSNGALTQTPPVSGFRVNAGVAVSPTRLLLNLDYPIDLGV